MDVQIETLSNLNRKLKITVPTEIYSAEYEKTVKELKGTIKVNGFRAGKVPKTILEKRYKESFRANTLEKLIPEYINKAIEQKELQPAYRPEINNLKMDLGEPLYFEADFEVVPQADVNFEEMFELEKPDISVSADAVNEEFSRLQKQYGIKEEINEKAGLGNIVKISILEQNGNSVPEDADPVDIELQKDNAQLKDVIDALIDTQAGEIKEVTLKKDTDQNTEKSENSDHGNPDEKDSTIKFMVKSVIKIIPANIDDDFFKKFDQTGKINSEEKVKEQIRQNILNENVNRHLKELQSKVRTAVYEKLDFDLPQRVVDDRKKAIFDDMKQTEVKKQMYNNRFIHDKDTDEKNSPSNSTDEAHKKAYEIRSDEELEKISQESARKDLKIMYFVDSIYKKQNLKVGRQELLQNFVTECYYRNLGDPKKYMQSEEGKGLLNYVEQILVESKVLNYMIKKKYGDDFIPIPADTEATN